MSSLISLLHRRAVVSAKDLSRAFKHQSNRTNGGLLRCSTALRNLEILRNCSFQPLEHTPERGLSGEIGAEERSSEVRDFFERVNETLERTSKEHHLAVVHIYGVQYVIKEGDMIMVKKDVAAQLGEKIKFEKVLLLANKDVTLVGRPLLDRNLVHAEATVVEKTMTHTILDMKHTPRCGGRRTWKFRRHPLTMLRINEVRVCHQVNSSQTEVF